MIETRKAHELDIVELTEDLPQYDLKRGARGAVVEVFDKPEEAYMLEFVDESGTSSVIADWVKPSQINNVSAAKAAFEQGWRLFEQGKHSEAEKYFRKAVALRPNEIKVLNNSLVNSLEVADVENRWKTGIKVFSFALRIDPAYETTRRNLAIAYFRRGIQQGLAKNHEQAVHLFQQALLADSSPELAEKVKKNLAVAYAAIAERFLTEGKLNEAAGMFEQAQLAGCLTAAVFNDYAITLVRLGRFDDAISAFERGLSHFSADETLQENLVNAQGAAEELRRAGTKYEGVLPAEIEYDFPDFQIEREQEYLVAA